MASATVVGRVVEIEVVAVVVVDASGVGVSVSVPGASATPNDEEAMVGGGDGAAEAGEDAEPGGAASSRTGGELARAAPLCPAASRVLVLAAGTDGTDGPTDAAGAVVSASTVAGPEIQKRAEEALANHDSYSFFANVRPEAHLKTGPTGTNLGDVLFVLVE